MNKEGLAGRGNRNIGEEGGRDEDAGQYYQGKGKTNNKLKTEGDRNTGEEGGKVAKAQPLGAMPTLDEAEWASGMWETVKDKEGVEESLQRMRDLHEDDLSS